ncbi:hypothetical protein FRC03_011609 [Tulasnella sp. 419]|nr:hypothetical protein FRC03_011609 [Tulasnella sp. 419]
MSKSFWQKFWSKHLICEDVKRLSTMLKDAHDDFIRGIGLVSASAGIMLVAASNHIHGNTSSGEDQTDGIILKWTDVDLQEDLMAPDTDSCNFWSGTAVARVHNRAVLVKRYIGDDRDAKIKNFLCDLEYLKRARHSNLPRLYGFSRTASEVPFVVIETAAIMPARQYLEVSPPTITGLWCLLLDVYSAAMFICRSTSSSLDYRSLVEATMLDENGKAIITPERHGSSNKPSRVVNVRVEAQKFAAAVCSSVWSLPMSYPTVSLFKQYQPLVDILGGERRQVDLLHVDRRLIRNPDTAESMILEWQHETLQALNINVLP